MSKTDSLHYQLCCEGSKWLFRQKYNYDRCQDKPCHIPEFCKACKKYNYVAVELCTWDTENTDVWGLGNFCDSAVIEVKVSHADFKADQKKWHRSKTAEDKGMQAGRLRWYLCPEGVIKPEELPDKWGLLYWDGKKISIIVGAKPFENTGWADINILASLLRREDFPKKIFNYRGVRTGKEVQPVLPGIEEPGIPGRDFIPVEWVDACEMYGKWKIVKQEQPEVDFETEYAKFSNDPNALDYAFPIDLADYKDFARHFYELGLKARKEVQP